MIIQYVIQCFDASGIGPNGPIFDNSKRLPVNVIVFADSENEAVERAKKYINRDFYKLLQIQEFKDPNEEIKNMRKKPWEI